MQELLASLSSPPSQKSLTLANKPIRSGDMIPISDDNLAEAELSLLARSVLGGPLPGVANRQSLCVS